MTPLLSVCIATKDRPDDLTAALRSLAFLRGLDFEVVVTDDASAEPAAEVVERETAALGVPVAVVRNDPGTGYIVARNAMARRAVGRYVLCLDDDARLIDGAAVRAAVAALEADPTVAAAAFAQETGEAPGRLHWHQPARVEYPCYVRTFYGYAHLLRRDTFLRLGGFRELFHYYHEEPEYCKRLLDAGFRVVFHLDWRVIHPGGPRVTPRVVRYMARNRLLELVLLYPAVMAAAAVPAILWSYRAQRRAAAAAGGPADSAGWWWPVAELVHRFPAAVRQRTRVRVRTLLRWRALGKSPQPVAPAAG